MIVVHVLEPFASGVTTAVAAITRALPDWEHVVVHGARTGADSVENSKKRFPDAVRFIPWKHAGRELSLFKDTAALFSLMGILRKLKKEEGNKFVVHLHSSKAGFLGRLACRLLNIRAVVYTPHGASFLRQDVGPGKRRFFRFLENVAGAFGGLVVGCGPGEGALYRSRWVANGVVPAAEVFNLKEEGKKRQVCFAGIANRQKDSFFFNALTEAFFAITPAEEEIPFIWAGDGALRDSLTSPHIRVTGWIGAAEVQKLLRQSLVYLSTAAWEGLPYGVLEAMNAGCALLLRDIPGHRDLVASGVNGFLFSTPEEGAALLKKMLADEEKTLEMGRESRRMIRKNFSLELMGRGYRAIYEGFFKTA